MKFQRIGAVLAALAVVTTGCAAHRAPPLPAALASAFDDYRVRLRAVWAGTDAAAVVATVDGWLEEHPPTATEGDLYAALLTDTAHAPPAGVQRVAEALLARVPNHPGAWRAELVLFNSEIAQDNVAAAAIWYERLRASHPAVSAAAGRRLAAAYWRTGATAASLRLAVSLGRPADAAGGAYWPWVLQAAWACCDKSDGLGDELEPLFDLKAALAAGDTAGIRRGGEWGQRFARAHDLGDAWAEFFDWFASFAPATPPQGDPLGLLLPLSGGSEALGRRVLWTTAACALAGERYDVRDTRGRGALAAASLSDTGLPRRIYGPLRGDELIAVAPTLLRTGRVAVTPNPNPLTQVPVTAPIWAVAMTPEGQAVALAKLLAAQGWRAVSVIAPDDDYGDRFFATFWDAVTASGGWFTGVGRLHTGDTDFGAVIRPLVGLDRLPPEAVALWKTAHKDPPPVLDFDVLVLVGNSAQLALVPGQLAYYDVSGVRLVGDAGWQAPSIRDLAGDYISGLLYVDLQPGDVTAAAAAAYRDCMAASGHGSTLDAVVFTGQQLLRELGDEPRPYHGFAPFPGLSGDVRAATGHSVALPLSVWRWTRRGTIPWDGTDPAPPPAATP